MAAVLRLTSAPGRVIAAAGSASMSSDTSGASWLTAQPSSESSMGSSMPVERLERTTGGHEPEEPSLLDHQRDGAAVGLEQIACRRLGDLLHQAVEIGAGQQGARPDDAAAPTPGCAGPTVPAPLE